MTSPAAPLVVRFGPNPNVAAGGRDLVVGDVHGCFSKLRAALEAVAFQPGFDRLFSVGDLVDRGPESADVLWWLAQPWFAAVAGNHEAMGLMYHRGQLPAQMLVVNGGGWFVAMTREERQPFVDAFAGLPVAIELETPAGLVGLVHADCPTRTWPTFVERLAGGGKGAELLTEAAQWSRDRVSGMGFAGEEVAGVRAVLVGHTPMERVTTLGNVHFLDTGAWLQGGRSPRPFGFVDAATLSPAYGSSLSWTVG